MRRVWIVYYWFFNAKNNVSFIELIKFFFKPTVRTVANHFIEKIEPEDDDYRITFKNTTHRLYWPKQFSIEGIYQVTSKTFDKSDWHFYQKEHTEVVVGEIILDIGTAEGLFTLSVIDKCKKMILIEPNDYFVVSLAKTFADFQDKVKVHNMTVGQQAGEISFNSASLSSGVNLKGSGDMKKRMETVDNLVSNEPFITYLKADIEGFELDMLKGAQQTIKKHKPKIAITAYHTENNSEEMIGLIKEFVPEYNHYVKGVFHEKGKPVMIHFWI